MLNLEQNVLTKDQEEFGPMIAPLAALLRLHELEHDASKASNSSKVKSERSRLQLAMSPVLTEKYESTVKRFGLHAVVPIERGICTGCYVRQPSNPTEVDEEIYQCENCGRMVYDPDAAFEYSLG